MKGSEDKIDFHLKQDASFSPLQENSLISSVSADRLQQKETARYGLDECLQNNLPSVMNQHNSQNYNVAQINQLSNVNTSLGNTEKPLRPGTSPYNVQNKPLLDLLRMRSRTNISPEKTAVLETAFNSSPFPTSQTKVQLAQMTGLPEKVISVWFQNRRQRIRKESSFLP